MIPVRFGWAYCEHDVWAVCAADVTRHTRLLPKVNNLWPNTVCLGRQGMLQAWHHDGILMASAPVTVNHSKVGAHEGSHHLAKRGGAMRGAYEPCPGSLCVEAAASLVLLLVWVPVLTICCRNTEPLFLASFLQLDV